MRNLQHILNTINVVHWSTQEPRGRSKASTDRRTNQSNTTMTNMGEMPVSLLPKILQSLCHPLAYILTVHFSPILTGPTLAPPPNVYSPVALSKLKVLNAAILMTTPDKSQYISARNREGRLSRGGRLNQRREEANKCSNNKKSNTYSFPGHRNHTQQTNGHLPEPRL